jgi:hypothetical protein
MAQLRYRLFPRSVQWRIASIALVLVAIYMTNFHRWPAPLIRRWILWQAPMGSSRASINALKAKRHWQECGNYSEAYGVGGRFPGDSPEIGVASSCAYLGEAEILPPLPATQSLQIRWAFDGDGRLIEVVVDRESDGP